MRWWRVAAMLLLLALALAGLMMLARRGDPELPAHAEAESLRQDAGAKGRMPPGLAASGLAAASAADDAEDAKWCSRDTLAGPAPASAAMSAAALDAWLKGSPDQKKFAAARQALMRDWVGRLQARGDERSLALSLRLAADAESLSRLAGLARQTVDPAVYAWALQSCGLAGDACAGLGARQWARLDPDNLQAWLDVADEAQKQGDAQALREALYQAGLARRSERYGTDMLRRLQALWGGEREGLRQEAELAATIGVLAAQPIASLRPLIAYCRATAGNIDAQQLCAAALDALWQHGETVLDQGLALRLSRRLLPERDEARWRDRAEQLDAVKQLSLEQMMPMSGLPMEGWQTCQQAADSRALWLEIGQWGERGAWQRRLADRDVPALARRWREDHPSR